MTPPIITYLQSVLWLERRFFVRAFREIAQLFTLSHFVCHVCDTIKGVGDFVVRLVGSEDACTQRVCRQDCRLPSRACTRSPTGVDPRPPPIPAPSVSRSLDRTNRRSICYRFDIKARIRNHRGSHRAYCVPFDQNL